MTFGRLLRHNLFFHWRGNLAVLLGVAVGAAVLTGALLVGDSLRGSLRDLTLQRLDWVDYSLVGGRFFRQELALELGHSSAGSGNQHRRHGNLCHRRAPGSPCRPSLDPGGRRALLVRRIRQQHQCAQRSTRRQGPVGIRQDGSCPQRFPCGRPGRETRGPGCPLLAEGQHRAA